MKRLLLVISFLILLGLTLAACGGETLECTDEIGCVEVASDEPIKLASALVITTADAPLGLDSQHGVDLAVDFRGEVLGHEVEFQHEDDHEQTFAEAFHD